MISVRLICWLASALLLFSACRGNLAKECRQEVIDNPDYFSVDRVLSNNCTDNREVDYILTGNHVYSISADTRIEAGTTIEIADSAALLIETTGSFQVMGTVDAPVIIRGRHNSNGNWRGIFVRSTSELNQFHQLVLEDAGGAPIGGVEARGALVLLDEATISIDHSTISKSASYGIHVGADAKLSTFDNNTISYCAIPMCLYTTQTEPLSNTSQFFSNQNNYLELRIAPFIDAHYVWPRIQIPYRLTPVRNISTQYLSGTAHLTIEEGNTIEMSTGTGFSVLNGSKLSVIGTDATPILFTGAIKDYSTWKGFEFKQTQQDNRFEHVRIEHSGSQGAVMDMWRDPKLTLNEVDITYCSTCAFYDAPKTNQQAINPNLFLGEVRYEFVNGLYCKGS